MQRKDCSETSTIYPPFEFLMNCGKISVMIYENVNSSTAENYDVSLSMRFKFKKYNTYRILKSLILI